MEISGKVVTVLPETTGQGQNGKWLRQNLIIETSDRFPKKICITAWNDKAEALSRLKAGDEVKVSFDLESREYNGRWYTDVKAWKIEPVSSAPSQPAETVSAADAPPPVNDDLPF